MYFFNIEKVEKSEWFTTTTVNDASKKQVKTARFFDQKGQNRKVDLAGMQLTVDPPGSIRVIL